jgi:RHS repeat-associated protein
VWAAPPGTAIRELPLGFEMNQGQVDSRVRYLARCGGYSIFLTDEEAVLALRKPPDKPAALRMSLIGENHDARFEGLDPLPGASNYYLGNDPKQWQEGVRQYRRIARRGVYSGVDVIYFVDRGRLEYDFVVARGTNPEVIQLAFQGTNRLEIDGQGNLVAEAGGEQIIHRKPQIYQEVNGHRRQVTGGYVMRGKRRVGFQLGKYDRSLPLTIDPILYATYLGGSGSDNAYGVAMDAQGNVYVAGAATSTNFPVTPGAAQSSKKSTTGPSAFLSKLDPTLSTLLYSTYLGGSAGDIAFAVRLDANGNAYVIGQTVSPNFPTTPGAFQTAAGGNGDAFVSKFDATGKIVYSTYFGGNGQDIAFGGAVDSAGNTYIAGSTTSTNLVTTAGAPRAAYGGGGSDGFVAKLNPTGTALVYSTYLGGSGYDAANAIGIDLSGNAYVTGVTASTDFPATAGAYRATFNGGAVDGFVVKLSPTGTSLVYATYLGGSGADTGNSIAVDASGSAFITGQTNSSNFPTTPGAFQTAFGGGTANGGDAFESQLNPAGSALVYSTYIGGSGDDSGGSIALSLAGVPHVLVISNSANFPGQATASSAIAFSREARTTPLVNPPTLSSLFEWCACPSPQSKSVVTNPVDYAGSMGIGVESFTWTHDGAGDVTQRALAVGTGSANQATAGALQPTPAGPVNALVAVEQDTTPISTLPTVSGQPVGTLTDPVSTATGELFGRAARDLSLGGPLPLTFVRYYGSYLGINGVPSALGTNWMHNFDWKLAVSGSSATVTMFGGRAVPFTAPASGNVWTLKNLEPFAYQLVAQSGGSYRFYDPQSRLIYDFSGAGALVKIEDQNGNALTVTQGTSGPTDVADGLGRTLHLTYTNGQLTKVQDQTGRSVSFSYSGQNLATFQDGNGNVTTYNYTSQGSSTGLLTSTALPAGNKPYTQAFNIEGQVSSQADSGGHMTILAYDSSTNNTTITDPLGAVTQHVSPGFTRLTQVTDANSKVVNMGYDANNRRTSVVDRLGANTSLGYDTTSGYPNSIADALGNTLKSVHTPQSRHGFQMVDRTQVGYADGATVSGVYDTNGNLTKLVDPTAKTLTYTYDSHGQLVAATNPSGGTAKVNYNADGTVASLQTPAGDTYTLTFDQQKRMSKAGFPDGSSRTFAYDNMDHLVKTVDERGNTVGYSFDKNSRLTTITDPAGAVKAFVYDGNDRLTQSTNRLGKTRLYQYNEVGLIKNLTNEAGEIYTWNYDKLNRVTSILDPAGKGLTYGYTAEGVLSSSSDALHRTVNYTSDALGRITGIKTPLGENLAAIYDKLGRPVQFTDPLSHSASYTYDARGLLTGVSFPAGLSASFTYGELRRLTSLKDGNGSVWSQTFDVAGRPVSHVDPLGRTSTYSYSARDRLTGISTPIGSSTFAYDVAGNLTEIKYSDGLDLKFTADSQNRITSVNGVSLSYDAEGRIASSNGLVVDRDGVGRISGITVASGKKISYAYSTRGLLSSVTDWKGGVTSFAYDDAGQLVSVTRPNGIVTSYTCDGDGRQASVTDAKSGQTISSIVLHHDAAGRMTSADRNNPQSVSPAAGALTLSYDAASQVSAHTYDGLGRRTKDSLRTYTWDASSRLKAYSGSDGSATFTYDGFGNRISAASGGATENYVMNYALGLPSISVVRGTSGDLRYYVHLPDGRLLYSIEAADNSRRFFHFDEIGSTVFLSDDSGAVVQSYGVTPYGEAVSQSGNVANPFTYLGAYGVMQEGTTGLYYMRAREYDSTTASFLSPDPLRSRDPRAINPYQYALANPLSHRDPAGLQPVPEGDFRLYEHGVGYWDNGVATYVPREEYRTLPKKLQKRIIKAGTFLNEQVAPILETLFPSAGPITLFHFGTLQIPHQIQGSAQEPPPADQQQVPPDAGPNPGGTPPGGAQKGAGNDTKVILPNTNSFEKWVDAAPARYNDIPKSDQYFLPYLADWEFKMLLFAKELLDKQHIGIVVAGTTYQDSELFKVMALVFFGWGVGDGGMATVDPPNFQVEDGPPTPPVHSIVQDLTTVIIP